MSESQRSKEKLRELLIQIRSREQFDADRKVTDYLGVHNSYFGRWMKGLGFPQHKVLPKLAQLLGWTVDELYIYLEIKPPHQDAREQFALPGIKSAVQELSVADKLDLAAFIANDLREGFGRQVIGGLHHERSKQMDGIPGYLSELMGNHSIEFVRAKIKESGLSDSDVERFMSGATPTDEDLIRIGRLSMKLGGQKSHDELERMRGLPKDCRHHAESNHPAQGTLFS